MPFQRARGRPPHGPVALFFVDEQRDGDALLQVALPPAHASSNPPESSKSAERAVIVGAQHKLFQRTRGSGEPRTSASPPSA